jgi:hypothetical protein
LNSSEVSLHIYDAVFAGRTPSLEPKMEGYGEKQQQVSPLGRSSENISTGGPLNCRSLHSAPPDFLLNLVALAKFVGLSLRKARYAALSGAAK